MSETKDEERQCPSDATLHLWEAHGEVLRWSLASGPKEGPRDGLGRLVSDCEVWYRIWDAADQTTTEEGSTTAVVASGLRDESEAPARPETAAAATRSQTESQKNKQFGEKLRAEIKGKTTKFVEKVRKWCSS
jgi:hypothetical protein